MATTALQSFNPNGVMNMHALHGFGMAAPTAGLFSATAIRTWEFFVRPTVTGRNGSPVSIVNMSDGGASGGKRMEFGFETNPSTPNVRLNALIVKPTGFASSLSLSDITFSGLSIGTGVWAHIVMRCSSTNLQIYCARASSSITFPSGYSLVTVSIAPATSLKAIRVGSAESVWALFGASNLSGPAPADWFKGSIAEIRCWSTARSDSQINTNKSVFIAPGSSGLLHQWRLNDFWADSPSDYYRDQGVSAEPGPGFWFPTLLPDGSGGLDTTSGTQVIAYLSHPFQGGSLFNRSITGAASQFRVLISPRSHVSLANNQVRVNAIKATPTQPGEFRLYFPRASAQEDGAFRVDGVKTVSAAPSEFKLRVDQSYSPEEIPPGSFYIFKARQTEPLSGSFRISKTQALPAQGGSFLVNGVKLAPSKGGEFKVDIVRSSTQLTGNRFAITNNSRTIPITLNRFHVLVADRVGPTIQGGWQVPDDEIIVGEEEFGQSVGQVLMPRSSQQVVGGFKIVPTHTATEDGEFRIVRIVAGPSMTGGFETTTTVLRATSPMTGSFRVDKVEDVAAQVSRFYVLVAHAGRVEEGTVMTGGFFVEGQTIVTEEEEFGGSVGYIPVTRTGETVVGGFVIGTTHVTPSQTGGFRVVVDQPLTPQFTSGFRVLRAISEPPMTGSWEIAPPAGQLFNRSGPSVQGAFYVVRDRFLQVTGGFSVVTDPDNIERAISRVNTLWRSSRS